MNSVDLLQLTNEICVHELSIICIIACLLLHAYTYRYIRVKVYNTNKILIMNNEFHDEYLNIMI